MLRCGLLFSHDLFVSKKRVDLRGDVMVLFGSCDAIKDGRDQVTPRLATARSQFVDPFQHGFGQGNGNLFMAIVLLVSFLKIGILYLSYHSVSFQRFTTTTFDAFTIW